MKLPSILHAKSCPNPDIVTLLVVSYLIRSHNPYIQSTGPKSRLDGGLWLSGRVGIFLFGVRSLDLLPFTSKLA